MYKSLFIILPIKDHRGCFQVLAIMDKGAMNSHAVFGMDMSFQVS